MTPDSPAGAEAPSAGVHAAAPPASPHAEPPSAGLPSAVPHAEAPLAPLHEAAPAAGGRYAEPPLAPLHEAGPAAGRYGEPLAPLHESAPAAGPEELYELGGRLLEQGEAAKAADVFALALQRLGAADPGRGQLLGGLGIARLEQALGAFAEAVECGDASVRPLAVELLARALPLRDRDDEAAQMWQRGVTDHDAAVAGAVRARLRRAFGADAESAPEFWWDGFMESAVCHGTLPVLANELFAALDHLYALVAVPYARHARERELWEALAAAVRVPSGYAWGPDLQESFRERLRDVVGADSDVLPPGWPDRR